MPKRCTPEIINSERRELVFPDALQGRALDEFGSDMNQSNFGITLCCIVKDEDDYIKEWAAFHLSVGADHLVVVDNGHSKNLPEILAEFIREGEVTLFRFPPRKKAQREAYERVLARFRHKTRWLGFFDVDEFVFPTHQRSLRDTLHAYENYAGLAVNWVSFGSGGLETPPAGWVTETFLERGPLDHTVPLRQLALETSPVNGETQYRPINSHVKCFVNPRETFSFRTAHHFKHAPGKFSVTENFDPIDGPFSEYVSVNQIRVNHYWSKSLAELRAKIDKGRISQATKTRRSGYDLTEALSRENASRGVIDTEILRFLPAAKELAEARTPLHGNDFEHKVRRLRYPLKEWTQSKTKRLLNGWRRIARLLITRLTK